MFCCKTSSCKKELQEKIAIQKEYIDLINTAVYLASKGKFSNDFVKSLARESNNIQSKINALKKAINVIVEYSLSPDERKELKECQEYLTYRIGKGRIIEPF